MDYYWLFNGGTTAPPWAATFFGLLLLWSLFWKGLALWHSARRSEQWWFVIMLFINTAGILELVYLFLYAKLRVRDLFSYHSGDTTADHAPTSRSANT